MRAWLALGLACGCLDAPPASSVESSGGFLAEPVRLALDAEDGWVAADVSAYAPVGASGVLLAVLNPANENNQIGLRKRGSSDDRTQFGGYDNFHGGYIGVDVDRVFEYWIDDPGAQEIWLLGSTGSEAVFFDDAVDVSVGAAGEWLDVEVSSLPGCEGAIGAYVEHTSPTPGAGWGLRPGGSSDERVPGSADPRHGWALIGLDADGRFQHFVQDTGVDLWLVGCQLGGAVFHTDGVEREPAAGDSWVEIAAPSGATGVVYEMGVFTTAGCDVGVRPGGSAVDLEGHARPDGHAWMMAGVGEGIAVEATRETTDCKLWEVGYFTR